MLGEGLYCCCKVYSNLVMYVFFAIVIQMIIKLFGMFRNENLRNLSVFSNVHVFHYLYQI